MPTNPVPDIVIGRLPIYLRALAHLLAQNKHVISSEELGQRVNISAAQIRKDLSYFGEFGKQGSGYNIAALQAELCRILKIEKERPVVLIGVGDLGHALAYYGGFAKEGFRIVALLDNDPAKIGTEVNGIAIKDAGQLETTIKEKNIQTAIIAVSVDAAQSVADVCVRAGVKAILNYASITLSVPEGVRVQYIDPVAYLQRMMYYL